MKRTLLIAGGTGFIGYHLAKKAIKKGFKVISLSKNNPSKKRTLKKIKYIRVDLKNYMSLKKIKIDPDYIVNLSGYVDHTNKKKTYQSHYIGCKNLALISLKKNIKNFIKIGSIM